MSPRERMRIRAETWLRTKRYAWNTFLWMVRHGEGFRRAIRLAWACRNGGDYWLCDDCGKATRKRDLREVWMLSADLCPECVERFNEEYSKAQAELREQFESA